MPSNPEQIKKIRRQCLTNAESLLSVAEKELNTGIDHVCFHLALLALEEIGKSILVTIGFTLSVTEKEGVGISIDDHIKKIFWALWGGVLTGEKFSKEKIEQSKGLATTLHERRLFYLYTDPNNPIDPNEKIEKGEAERLIKLTRACLELERSKKLIDKFEDEDIKTLKWFFKATEDTDKRKFIFGTQSIKKLQELQNGKEWINWVRGVFLKNEEEMRKLAEQELKRQKPSSEEVFKSKYKMRIRIQSQSHSIRNNAFQKWNEGVNDIKLYKSDKKNLSEFAKSEFFADFTFPKAIPIYGLWDHGFFMAKTLVISLNIATKGLFWWNVQKDIENFFEYIVDLEADKKESVKIGMRKGKRLSINWGNMTLNQREMGGVNMIFAYLLKEHKKLKDFLAAYAFGMVIFSKIDIHLRLEANAFDEFFKALKSALIIFNDWDGKNDLKESIKKQFSRLSDLKDLDKTIQFGIEMDLQKKKVPNITLTEVAAIKLYCDFYIQMKAHDYFERLKKEGKLRRKQSN